MNGSAAIAHSLLRQAWPQFPGGQAGGLAAQSVNVLITRCIWKSNGSPVRLPPSRLRAPVSQRDCRVPIALWNAMGGTQRTVMNNPG